MEEIVSAVEERHGQADRIWVMDRGMVSEENLGFLREGGRRYILGASKNQTRRWESQIATQGWSQVRDGLEVKLCPGPDGEETFILCRSATRQEKDQSIRTKAVDRMEKALTALAESWRKRSISCTKIHERIGRLRERYSRASRMIQTDVVQGDDDRWTVEWSRRGDQVEWAELADGCYVLRTNVSDWTGEELPSAVIPGGAAQEKVQTTPG